MESIDLKLGISELESKVSRMLEQFRPGQSPHGTDQQGIYDHKEMDCWTSGFWPGILWIMHDMTGQEHFKEAAWDWDRLLEEWLVRPTEDMHHDVGFQFLCTAVIKYKITGDVDARRRGLEGANFLAGRFNPAGNFIRAWNWDKTGWAIIDCMMNVSLLFWASEEAQDPRYKHIAVRHADTAMKHFVREDGSVRHIVSFDPETGEFLRAHGGQGFGPDSSWSRGAAWALYGFANTYRYTGDERYLNTAKRVAHFYIASLPEDAVPYWDFRLPTLDGEPRDSSAAAIATSGLLELAELVPAHEQRLYRGAAERTLRSLATSYRPRSDEYQGILLEATGNRPKNHYNTSLIYGDYYFVEAMAKWNGWDKNIF